MKNALYIALIIGFLAVDFFFFHDIFKTGEVITAAQYLTGILSIPVFIISAGSILRAEAAQK
ncbi:MAG TPA: hypothetical protein VLF91_02505 [Candidatus Saccharimonadales bacterium]|nr:hypothetical protein [Candidatus Saccharimonadales bacterium]